MAGIYKKITYLIKSNFCALLVINNEFFALDIFVVSSFSNALFWPRGASSELVFLTTLLGATTCDEVCLALLWLCIVVSEVGFPPIPPGTSFCEAVRFATLLLFLGVLIFALLSVTFTALVCCVYHLH